MRLTMKIAAMAVAAGVCLAALPQDAEAAPQLSIRVTSSISGLIGQQLGETDGDASVLIGNAGGFSSLIVSATGVPQIPTPEISTISLQTAATGPVILTVEITQTGLAAFAGTLLNTFTGNTLNSNGAYSNFTISHYFNADNAAFGTGSLMASTSYTGVGAFSTGPVSSAIDSVGNVFSETVIYSITFTGAGNISGTSQISNIPEPATLALLGAGLLGLAGIRRASRRPADA